MQIKAQTLALSNEKTKYFTDTSTEEIVVEYKSRKKVAYSKNKATNSSWQFYRIPEKTAGDDTIHSDVPAHEKAILNSKSTNLEYLPMKTIKYIL